MIFILGGAFDPPHVWHTAIVRSLLYFYPECRVIIVPSWRRDDKAYHTTDQHRLEMLYIFLKEFNSDRIILDDYFVCEWKEWNMITRDVDKYVREKYGNDICHVFGSDVLDSMMDWDSEQYAAKIIKKIIVPRGKQSGVIIPEGIENVEILEKVHIPDISSTDIRASIPDYCTIHARFAEDPNFIMPGLSKRVSQYILEHNLYKKIPEKKTKNIGSCLLWSRCYYANTTIAWWVWYYLFLVWSQYSAQVRIRQAI